MYDICKIDKELPVIGDGGFGELQLHTTEKTISNLILQMY